MIFISIVDYAVLTNRYNTYKKHTYIKVLNCKNVTGNGLCQFFMENVDVQS